MLKIQDQNARNLYPIQVYFLPIKNGSIMPGRSTSIKTVKTNNTQKA